MNADREQETTEVRETSGRADGADVRRQTVTRTENLGAGVIAARIVYFIGGVIIALLVVRVILLLLAANRGAPFVDFIYDLSGVFAWPFYGIFNYQPAYGSSVFEISSVVAILVYALVTAGLAKLFTLGSARRDV